MPPVSSTPDTKTCLAQVDQRLGFLPPKLQTLRLFADRIEVFTRGPLVWEKQYFMLDAFPEKLDRLPAQRLFRLFKNACWIVVGVIPNCIKLFGDLGVLDYLPGLIGGVLIGMGGYGFINALLSSADRFVLTYDDILREEPAIALYSHRRNRRSAQAFLDELAAARRWFVEGFAHGSVEQDSDETRQLRKFADLHAREILTDDEFARVKARILGASRGRAGFGPKPALDLPDKQSAPPSPG